MHRRRRRGHALGFTQERRLFIITFNEMDVGTRLLRKSAGYRQAGETASRPQIDPNLRARYELEQLQRVGNVPCPQMQNRGRRNQVCGLLPRQQKRNEAIEAFKCFT